MQLKVKYLFPETEELRTRAGDSGYDLRAAIKEPLVIDPHGRTTVGTGIAVEVATEMNIDLELQVRPRSGHTVKGIVAQFGTIEAVYQLGCMDSRAIERYSARAAINPVIHDLERLRANTWDQDKITYLQNWLRDNFWDQDKITHIQHWLRDNFMEDNHDE